MTSVGHDIVVMSTFHSLIRHRRHHDGCRMPTPPEQLIQLGIYFTGILNVTLLLFQIITVCSNKHGVCQKEVEVFISKTMNKNVVPRILTL